MLLRVGGRAAPPSPGLAGRPHLAVLGGPSGSGLARPHELEALAAQLGIADAARFVPPVSTAAAGAVVSRRRPRPHALAHSSRSASSPSRPQACGTPVVAADVGGLPMAVGDAGLLVEGHDIGTWTDAVESLLRRPARRGDLGRRAAVHAKGFGWGATTDRLLEVYAEARLGRRPPTPIDDSRRPRPGADGGHPVSDASGRPTDAAADCGGDGAGHTSTPPGIEWELGWPAR